MAEPGRLLTAMVTPFDDRGQVEYRQARRLARALVDSGSDGVVVAGTTGEAPTLTREEKLALFAEVKAELGSRGTVVAGAGSNSTAESVTLAGEAEGRGVDAVMAVVPYYNKPTQEGLYRHFREIAEATRLPLVLYNVPGRTGTNMEAETAVRLSELENVAGIKEASGNIDQATRILDGARPGFLVWSGNDSDTFALMSLGAHGVVSIASHVAGRGVRRLVDLLAAGDQRQAAAEHRRLMPLFRGLFATTNPVPVKWCLNEAGMYVGAPRLPLLEPDARTASFLRDLLGRYPADLPRVAV